MNKMKNLNKLSELFTEDVLIITSKKQIEVFEKELEILNKTSNKSYGEFKPNKNTQNLNAISVYIEGKHLHFIDIEDVDLSKNEKKQ